MHSSYCGCVQKLKPVARHEFKNWSVYVWLTSVCAIFFLIYLPSQCFCFMFLFYSMILAFTHVRGMSEHHSIAQKTSSSDSLNSLHLPGTLFWLFFVCVKAFVCQVTDLVKGWKSTQAYTTEEWSLQTTVFFGITHNLFKKQRVKYYIRKWVGDLGTSLVGLSKLEVEKNKIRSTILFIEVHFI